jgi:hypothetical protein
MCQTSAAHTERNLAIAHAAPRLQLPALDEAIRDRRDELV